MMDSRYAKSLHHSHSLANEGQPRSLFGTSSLQYCTFSSTSSRYLEIDTAEVRSAGPGLLTLV